jgi:ABC-type nitrate/sulfonate/bicarbonate transport system substrate-binding protein
MRALCAVIIMFISLTCRTGAVRAEGDTVNVGYALCAHCLSMSLTPQFAKGVTINATRFTSGNDVLTALIGGSVDVAQVTYLHFIRALDRGIPIVAISGQVNGGSEVLTRKDLGVKTGDWNGLKSAIAQYKKDGKPFRVGASRGNAQDIAWRGEFKNHGIDPDNDVQFVNISNPADHLAALNRGEIEVISSVEPFASQIRLVQAGHFFSFPYDQDAGKLTNLIVTKPDYAQKHPREVQAVVGAVVGLVNDLKTPSGHDRWLSVIKQNTALDETVAKSALENAFPDYDIHFRQMLAMSRMMYALKYTEHVVQPNDIETHTDYSYLSKATGKTKEQLGYAH